MNMTVNNKLLIILIALLAITAISWAIATFNLMTGKALGIAIVLLAFLKVRLIIIHYMEARQAILPIRLAFEAWVFIAASGTLLLYIQ